MERRRAEELSDSDALRRVSFSGLLRAFGDNFSEVIDLRRSKSLVKNWN